MIKLKIALRHGSSKKGARQDKRTGRWSRGRTGQAVATFHARMRIGKTVVQIKKRILKSATRRSKRLKDEGRVSKPVLKKEVSQVSWHNVDTHLDVVVDDGDTSGRVEDSLASGTSTATPTDVPSTKPESAKSPATPPAVKATASTPAPVIGEKRKAISGVAAKKKAAKEATKAMKRARTKK